jgi:hypothetical protein
MTLSVNVSDDHISDDCVVIGEDLVRSIRTLPARVIRAASAREGRD